MATSEMEVMPAEYTISMDNYLQQAKEIISKNIYMVIASASRAGEPWISPVFFAYDYHYNLFWVSNKESRHSTLIRNNPRVAIVIFDSHAPEGEGNGVYIEATIDELTDEEDITQAMKVLSKRVTRDECRVKKIEEVTGDGMWRIYRATPMKMYTLDEGKYVNGQYVDTRAEINFRSV